MGTVDKNFEWVVEKMRGVQSFVWFISYSIPMDETFPLPRDVFLFTLGDNYSKLGLFSFQRLTTLESNRKSRHF